jgi:hypothetical protein
MLRAALAVLSLAAAPALAQGIAVEDPYAITPVPGAPTGAAYMMIRNDGAAPDRLVGARSPAAELVELHAHREEDGVMRMRPVEGGLDLPAGSTLPLERGGAHVMLMGLTDPLEDGEVIPITLIFETAGEVAVEVPVDLARLAGDARADAAAEHAGHGEGHEGH